MIINSNSTQTTSSNSDYDIGLYINRTSSKTFSDDIKEKLLKIHGYQIRSPTCMYKYYLMLPDTFKNPGWMNLNG